MCADTLPPDVRIVMLGEPKGKGRPRFSRATGRAFTPAATVSYEGMLKVAATEAMGSRRPLAGALRISVVARMPVPRSWSNRKREAALAGRVDPTGRPDIDNIVKMMDALNHIVWTDDSQIVQCVATKRYDDQPAFVLEVWQKIDFME